MFFLLKMNARRLARSSKWRRPLHSRSLLGSRRYIDIDVLRAGNVHHHRRILLPEFPFELVLPHREGILPFHFDSVLAWRETSAGGARNREGAVRLDDGAVGTV